MRDFSTPQPQPGTDFIYNNTGAFVPETRTTVFKSFATSAKLCPDAFFCRYRQQQLSEEDGSVEYLPIEAMTYGEALDTVKKLARSIHAAGLKPGDRMCIYAANRPEWQLTDMACQLLGIVTVPLFDNFSLDDANYVITHSDAIGIIVDPKRCVNLKKIVDQFDLQLDHIFLMDMYVADKQWFCDEVNAEFTDILTNTFNVLVEDGSKNPEVLPHNCDVEDLATIIYTSGTSSRPKGAMLCHRNVMSGAASVAERMPAPEDAENFIEESVCSFLPLAHIFERAVEQMVILMCGCICFFSGTTTMLSKDLNDYAPTIFCGVPRLFNKLYSSIVGAMNEKGFISRFLFNWGLSRKKARLQQGLDTPTFNNIVFQKVKDKFGGKFRLVVSGSAPLDPAVLEFFRCVFCNSCVIEGYGITETVAALSIMKLNDRGYGHVGTAIGAMDMKLEDGEVIEPFKANPNWEYGEVLVKGPNIFKGYYKNPEATAKAVNEDGYYHTGDIGAFDEDGNLHIIDRISSIFKSPQGEFICPESVEKVFLNNDKVTEMIVFGGAPKLVSIVIPAEYPETEEAAEDLKNELLSDFELLAIEHGLKGYEKVVDLVFVKEFSIEDGTLTPSMKKKRPAIRNFYRELVDEMVMSANQRFGNVIGNVNPCLPCAN
ncbi:hypothetical protein PCE1_003725 [Barthelona sp. PCE]